MVPGQGWKKRPYAYRDFAEFHRERDNPMRTTLIAALFGTTPDSLRNATDRYCETIWLGWRDGKAQALANPNNPFVGGPKDLIEAGITTLVIDGVEKNITPLTRIRVRQLDDAALEIVGSAMGKDLVAMRQAAADQKKFGGQDVVHQEFVATFAENVANAYQHYVNNAVAASSALVGAVALVDANEPVGTLIGKIEGILEGTDPEGARLLATLTRHAWIGRVVTSGEYKGQGDFVFDFQLGAASAALDEYVVKPVLISFLADLKAGYYNN